MQKIRMTNTLRRAYSNDHNNSPVALRKSPKFFNLPVFSTLHESYLNTYCIRCNTTSEYVITDNTKVVGYLSRGIFFNFKDFY